MAWGPAHNVFIPNFRTGFPNACVFELIDFFVSESIDFL